MEETLTLVDYLDTPLMILKNHPDFQYEAFVTASRLAMLTTIDLASMMGRDINEDIKQTVHYALRKES